MRCLLVFIICFMFCSHIKAEESMFTEEALKFFTHAKKVKAILNLNPSEPAINMQTTIMAKMQDPDLDLIKKDIKMMEKRVREYVPGYEVIVGPLLDNGRIFVTVRVKGLGDYLPSYAGNLDIINCAAVAVVEKIDNLQSCQIKKL